MAEVLDKDGELISWISDDPDDFNSYSDYEWRIYELVHRYNEMAFEAGKPLLWFRKFQGSEDITHDCLSLLSRLDIDAVPEFKDQLQEIKNWVSIRLWSKHPDDANRSQEDAEDEHEMFEEYKRLRHSDPKAAYETLYQLACHGNQTYMDMLSRAYEKGIGVEKSFLRALYWNDQSLSHPKRSKRLRQQLIDAGVTIPLDVAGIDYATTTLEYFNEYWWEAYYIKNGLIKRTKSNMKVFEFNGIPFMLPLSKLCKPQQRIYEAIARMGGFVYPAFCEYRNGWTGTEYVSLSVDQVRQLIDGNSEDVLNSLNATCFGFKENTTYKKVAPIAHIQTPITIYREYWQMTEVYVTLSVESVMGLVGRLHDDGFITMSSVKEFCPGLFNKIQNEYNGINEDRLVTSEVFDTVATILYGDSPESDEISVYDYHPDLDFSRHLVASIDEDSISIDQEAIDEGEVDLYGTMTIDDRDAFCHLIHANRCESILRAFKALCVGDDATWVHIAAFLERNDIPYTITP